MKKSLFKIYKGEIIIFFAVSAVLLAVASFADLKIDILLSCPDAVLANWFARTGEMPASVMSTIACAFIAKCAKPKWLKAVGGIATLIVGASFGDYFGGRLFEEDEFQTAFSIIFGVGVGLCILFALHFIVIPENLKSKLLLIAVLGLIALGIRSGLCDLMKGIWGRTRFYDLAENYSDFTPWYVLNKGGSGHSFPSGHTSGAGMAFLLMMLPVVSGKCEKYKTALFAAGWLYTAAVAVTRLMRGAHYLSDVTVGAVLAFASVLLVIFIYEKTEKHLLPLIDKYL